MPSSLIEELASSVRGGRLLTYNSFAAPKLYPVAGDRDITSAEAQLGFTLPLLLKDIYLHVANGGFGPGYGLLGIHGGAYEPIGDKQYTMLDLYKAFRNRRKNPPWPDFLLPIAYWGCEIYSCVDCQLSEAPVFAFDPNRHGDGPWRCDCRLHANSLTEWLRRWLDGEDLWRNWPLAGPPKMGFEENT